MFVNMLVYKHNVLVKYLPIHEALFRESLFVTRTFSGVNVKATRNQ